MPGHADIDRASLELARAIAARIDADPSLVSIARENLSRWKTRNADAPSLIQCYEEWERILDCGWDHARGALLAETEEGQRLRQNSPFPGILSPREVWAIKRACREHVAGT
ncbi:MAG: hypothetical protein K2W85_10600 [Phycisphaerales bacterium]|nr:hypothetical protein [Phycisphaerales bacterium]